MATREMPIADSRTIYQESGLLKINSIDHVEFWAGNAKQTVFFWKAWGFKPVAYAGLETGNRRIAL